MGKFVNAGLDTEFLNRQYGRMFIDNMVIAKHENIDAVFTNGNIGRKMKIGSKKAFAFEIHIPGLFAK